MDEFEEFRVQAMTGGGRRWEAGDTKAGKHQHQHLQEQQHQQQQQQQQSQMQQEQPQQQSRHQILEQQKRIIGARTKPPLTRSKQSQWQAEDTSTPDMNGTCNNEEQVASKESLSEGNPLITTEDVSSSSENQEEECTKPMAGIDCKPVSGARLSPGRDRAAQLRSDARQSEKKVPPMRQMSSPGPVRPPDPSINKHARSQSCKKPVRPTELKVEEPPCTKPKSPAALRDHRTRLEKFKFWSQTSISEDEVEVFYTARMFVTSHKGIVKRGSTIRMRTFSREQSLESCTTASLKDEELLRPTSRSLASSVNSSFSQGSSFSEDVPTYKVVICGASGVGKSSLAEQFISSEYSNTGTEPPTGKSCEQLAFIVKYRVL